MTTFLKISDKIIQLSNGKIHAHYVKPYWGVLIIIVGVPFIWFGGYEVRASLGESYLLSIIGLCITFLGFFLLLRRKKYFTIGNSFHLMKPIRIPLDSDHLDEIKELMDENRIPELFNYKTVNQSPLTLEVWQNEKHDFIYLQLYFFHDAADRPISIVKVIPNAIL